jgi:replication factor A1
MSNYQKIIKRIARSSGMSSEEIERKVEAKRAKLSGLISKEGAAQVVASELGINFDKENVKISEVLPGMKKVNIVGKIIRLFPVREYEKNNKKGKIGSFILGDETSNIRTVLWDTNHISLIEKEEIKEGDVVEISNASIRNSELHLSGFSDIKLSNQKLDKVVEEKIFQENYIKDLNQGKQSKIRAVIVQAFNPRIFYSCPACGKKVSEAGECPEHGKVNGEKKAILNFILDDGTGTIRAVLFSEQIEKIMPKQEVDDIEKLQEKRQELLGKEMLFFGRIRQNKIFDNLEIYVEDIKEVDIDKLIAQLENK